MVLPEFPPAVVSDPDDDPILQTAIVGHAEILCTRGEAFHHKAVEQFCSAHNLRILDDISLMQELRQSAAIGESGKI